MSCNGFFLDLVCQAKSGTGKTCVFVVAALEAIDVKSFNTSGDLAVFAYSL